VAVTAALPVTAALGKEKQPCEREGLLDTVKEIVPVYPFFGLMVTLEVPALPEATVTLLAERVKLLEALVTVTVNEPLEEA